MNLTMTPRERLEAVFAGETPDRTPILGGWISCPDHIAALVGVSLDEYWEDPAEVSLAAYRLLGSDGLVSMTIPAHRDDFRIVDVDSYSHADTGVSLPDAVAQVEALPSPEQIETDFDFEADYQAFAADLRAWQARCGEMVWMPAQWGAGIVASWYGPYGYENFFLIVGLYPELGQKLMEVGGAYGRCRCRLIARAVQEGLYPHAVLLGEDICTQRGPMISPAFLEKHLAPALRYGLEPLLEVGCKPVWHCDGDVRPLLDMLLDAGVQGLQGFQPECGLTLETMIQRRTREGDPLVIFGPLSVTTELPVWTPDQVYAAVKHAINISRDQARLVLFTANTINPDVPLENVIAMHEAVGAVGR
ncbi:MAG TPA: uroporphyrinogen decarboxylase family protein [Armatimonadota bacterium]|jgi:hypothetical protein